MSPAFKGGFTEGCKHAFVALLPISLPFAFIMVARMMVVIAGAVWDEHLAVLIVGLGMFFCFPTGCAMAFWYFAGRRK